MSGGIGGTFQSNLNVGTTGRSPLLTTRKDCYSKEGQVPLLGKPIICINVETCHGMSLLDSGYSSLQSGFA